MANGQLPPPFPMPPLQGCHRWPQSTQICETEPPGVAVVVSKMKSKQWVDIPLLAWKAFFHSCSTEVFSKHQGWLQVKLSKSQIFSAENNKLPGNLWHQSQVETRSTQQTSSSNTFQPTEPKDCDPSPSKLEAMAAGLWPGFGKANAAVAAETSWEPSGSGPACQGSDLSKLKVWKWSQVCEFSGGGGFFLAFWNFSVVQHRKYMLMVIHCRHT